MGVHFTGYSSQLGVLVVVAFIVNANQDVFDGLRHDPRLPFTRPRVPMEQIGISEYGRVWAKYGRVERGVPRHCGAADGALFCGGESSSPRLYLDAAGNQS